MAQVLKSPRSSMQTGEEEEEMWTVSEPCENPMVPAQLFELVTACHHQATAGVLCH